MFEHDLHAYVRALMAPRAVRVGPFLIGLDPHDRGLYRNYAIPDDHAKPTSDDVAELNAAFARRERTPRLEYLPSLCPDVEPALLAAGFCPEGRLAVMTCGPGQTITRPAPEGIELSLAESDEQLWKVAEAQNHAYGQSQTTIHDVARLRSTVDRGGLVGLALDTVTRTSVGGGLCAPPHAGVSELAAIGVRPAYRRRGIAAALTVLLTQACFNIGITTPFLTPATKAEQRIYHSAGYRPVAEMLHISQSPGE